MHYTITFGALVILRLRLLRMACINLLTDAKLPYVTRAFLRDGA
jgi:hypothetical protein